MNIQDKIVERGYQLYVVKAVTVAKHYGLTYTQLDRLVRNNEHDEELLQECITKAHQEIAQCLKCYYKNRNAGCNYPLFFNDFLGTDFDTCPRYLEKEVDYDENHGCGMCKHYEAEDLFSGTCKLSNEQVRHYKPRCKDFREV